MAASGGGGVEEAGTRGELGADESLFGPPSGRKGGMGWMCKEDTRSGGERWPMREWAGNVSAILR